MKTASVTAKAEGAFPEPHEPTTPLLNQFCSSASAAAEIARVLTMCSKQIVRRFYHDNARR